MTLTPLLLTILLLTVFSSGVACTIAALVIWERRIIAQHGGKMGLALQLLDEAARDGAK